MIDLGTIRTQWRDAADYPSQEYVVDSLLAEVQRLMLIIEQGDADRREVVERLTERLRITDAVVRAAAAIPIPPTFKTGGDDWPDERRETICRGCYDGFDKDRPLYSHRAGMNCPHMRLVSALAALRGAVTSGETGL